MSQPTRRSTIDDIECIPTQISSRSNSLFKDDPKLKKAPFSVSRVFQTRVSKPVKVEEKGSEEQVHEREAEGRICYVDGEEVVNDSAVRGLKNNSDILQIFTIPQRRSWTSLPISLPLLNSFLSTNNIFTQFWKVLFTFGPKKEENEFDFPGYRARHNRRIPYSKSEAGKETIQQETFETAYMLRRVELNGRKDPKVTKDAWSIRQTGIYEQFAPSQDFLKVTSVSDFKPAEPICPLSIGNSLFLLVAPSDNVNAQISQAISLLPVDPYSASPWNIHRLLVADALKGWGPYMACLESLLKKHSNRIVCANVGSEKENLSPLTDFHITFVDRQDLKQLEDAVIDLEVILPTMLTTVMRIRDSFRRWLSWAGYGSTYLGDEWRDDVMDARDEFNEFVRDCEMLVERAKVLKERAFSTSKLLSDLLAYEEAVALKELAIESHQESQAMCSLTERSVKDASAMKILTIITLVYLPTTIVANFFSTQFIQTQDNGEMRLSDKWWLLAAISIPLTLATLALWWGFAVFSKPITVSIKAEELPTPTIAKARRQGTFKSLTSKLSFKKRPRVRTQTMDEEKGLGLGPGVFFPEMVTSPAQTFDTTATFPSMLGDEKTRWNSKDSTL